MKSPKPYILLFLLTILVSPIIAQSEGLKWKKEGKALERGRDFTGAIDLYEKAVKILDKESDLIPYYETIRDLSYAYLDVSNFQKAELVIKEGVDHYENQFKDSFLIIYPKMLQTLAQVHLDKNEYQLARIANRKALKFYQYAEEEKDRKKYSSYIYHNIGFTFSEQRLIDSALYYFQQALPLKLEILGPSSSSTQRTLRSISRIYQDWGQLDKAIKTINLALEASIKEKDKIGEAKAYHGLSQIYQRKRDFETAKGFISKTFQIYKNLGSTYQLNMAYTYHQMGNVLETERAHKESVEWYQKAKEGIRAHFKIPSYDEALSTMTLGKAFNYMAEQKRKDKEFDYQGMSVEELRAKAIEYYEENEGLFKASIPDDHVRYIELWLSKGACYLQGGDTLNAHKVFEKAYARAQKMTPSKSYDRSLSSLNLSLTHPSLDSALQLCQQGLWDLSNDWEFNSLADNPKPSQIFNDYWSMLIFKQKAHLLKTRFELKGDINDLYLGIDGVKSGDNLIEASREKMLTTSAKMNLAEVGNELYGQGLDMAYETNDGNIHPEVFSFMEKSKSLLLLESLQKGQYLKGDLLPDSLLQQLQNLDIEISKLQSEQRKLVNSDSISVLGSQIFELEKERTSLKEKVLEKFPILKISEDFTLIPALQNIQDRLSSNEVLYEYMESETFLFILKISENKTSFHRIKKIEYSSILDSLLTMVSSPEIALKKSNAPEVWDQYSRLAHQLFKQLLPEYNNEELIIVPDGQLNFLPFDILLTQPISKEVINYSRLPYLIKAASIRYGFSASILLAATQEKTSSENFLAYAPSYENNFETDDTRQGFGSIKYATQEVNRIIDIIKGEKFTSEEATESSFKEHAKNYRLIHLAMHAFIDNTDPMLSGMVFSDSEEDYILRAYEIYAMNIPSEMVVLSACNTNAGQYKEGEGVLSLARAFKYAGVEDIITTMWQVDDQATQEIMTEFYKNLSNGTNKAQSLRLAKLNYLEKSDHTFPHYWAASIFIDGELSSSSTFPRLFFLILLALCLLSLLFLYKKKSIKK